MLFHCSRDGPQRAANFYLFEGMGSGRHGLASGLAGFKLRQDGRNFLGFRLSSPLTRFYVPLHLKPRYRLAGLADDANRVDLMILAKAREASARTSAALTAFKAGGAQPEIQAQQRAEVAGVAPQAPNPAADRDDFIIAKLTEKSGIDSLENIARHLMAPEGHLRASEIASAERLAMPDLFPIEKVDHDGFTTATIGPVGQDLAGRMVYFAALYMDKRSPELDGALKAAVAKWSLDAATIVDFLGESLLFLPRLRGFLSAGVEAWFAGDDMKAIHVLVPQVEAAVREMLIAAGASPM